MKFKEDDFKNNTFVSMRKGWLAVFKSVSIPVGYLILNPV